MQLEKLIPVELREVWMSETSGFSTWLSKEENLMLLGNEVGLRLDLIKRESAVGKFRVDILAHDRNSKRHVIIENQLEDTDHSHLGQLITYSSHYEAKYIIWIIRDLRIEHEKAIQWLNLNLGSEINLFLVKIELFKIGNSLPAPKFTVLSKPFGWTNKFFRKEVEIEPFSKVLASIDSFKKKIVKESLIKFLDKYIDIDFKYPRIDLLKSYSKVFPIDCKFYFAHKSQFRKDMETWAIMRNLILNKAYQGEKYKGVHKSGGIEFITFSSKD